MSTLHKQLARYAQECQRVDADRWMLALTNGQALTVSVRRDDGFLLLDADTDLIPSPERFMPITERAIEFPAAVKFALGRGSEAWRLRAEFPLPEETGDGGERIREHLDGMRSAAHRLHNWVSCEAGGEDVACPEPAGDRQAIAAGLTAVLQEAGWGYHERPGGTLLADLETGSQFLQAEIGGCGAGALFRLPLYRHDAGGEAAQQALCLYLLEANAALRYARAFLERDGDGIAAGFEVRVESIPSAAEAGHALGALSVAGRNCARELEALKDDAVASIYRSARPCLHHRRKGA